MGRKKINICKIKDDRIRHVCSILISTISNFFFHVNQLLSNFVGDIQQTEIWPHEESLRVKRIM